MYIDIFKWLKILCKVYNRLHPRVFKRQCTNCPTPLRIGARKPYLGGKNGVQIETRVQTLIKMSRIRHGVAHTKDLKNFFDQIQKVWNLQKVMTRINSLNFLVKEGVKIGKSTALIIWKISHNCFNRFKVAVSAIA